MAGRSLTRTGRAVSRPHLRGHTPESLASLWPDLGLPAAAARRIVGRTVGEGRDDLEGVRGVSRALARAVLARSSVVRLERLDRRASPVDGFVKYLFRAPDGALLETVRIPLEKPRYSVCVSSQAGCALACAFCETGRMGLTRNLEAWEIVEQAVSVRDDSPERPVTAVVFQGQGEPLQNYDAVLRAAAILRDPNGLRIRGEAITISTAGLLPAIERYAAEDHVHRLILSLTSAIQSKREALVPLARRYPVADLARAMRDLTARRGGVVHVAWVLMAGVNTGEDEAEALARAFPDVPVRVHLIDVNDPRGRFAAPGAVERGRFLAALKARGLGFVRRYSGGADIAAACGLLASTTRGGVTA